MQGLLMGFDVDFQTPAKDCPFAETRAFRKGHEDNKKQGYPDLKTRQKQW
jgi:hypothetical protein